MPFQRKQRNTYETLNQTVTRNTAIIQEKRYCDVGFDLQTNDVKKAFDIMITNRKIVLQLKALIRLPKLSLFSAVGAAHLGKRLV
jgi:hypothetical protein